MKIEGKRYLLLKDLPFCDAGEIVAETIINILSEEGDKYE